MFWVGRQIRRTALAGADQVLDHVVTCLRFARFCGGTGGAADEIALQALFQLGALADRSPLGLGDAKGGRFVLHGGSSKSRGDQKQDTSRRGVTAPDCRRRVVECIC